MPAFTSMKRLLNKTNSSKQQSVVQERPASADASGSSTTQSPEGSIIQQPAFVAAGRTTPDSSLQSSASVNSLPKLLNAHSDSAVPQAPARPLSMLNLNRRSVTGPPMTMASQTDSVRSDKRRSFQPPVAVYAPRLINLTNNAQVFQKAIIVKGCCGEIEKAGHLLDGNLRISYENKHLAPHSVPVVGGYFKYLAHLMPGRNAMTLEFFSSKLKDNPGPRSNQSTTVTFYHIPTVTAPPLHLAFLVARDSPYLIDQMPERIASEGNGSATAVAKFRMAAQMCLAANGELMQRLRMGQRSFRLEEEWTMGTISRRNSGPRMRNEPKVHFIPASQTVAELQAIARAGNEAEILRIASDALGAVFGRGQVEPQHVAMMLMDSHWDPVQQRLSGHVCTTGGDEDFKISLMGSQFLFSLPSCIEDIGSVFQDCTRLEAKVSAPGMGSASSVWELAAVTLNSLFRNLMMMYGFERKSSGVNSDGGEPDRDRNNISRLFACREPVRASSRPSGVRTVTDDHEPSLSLLDALQMRFHPSFATAADEYLAPASRAFIWPLRNGFIRITSPTGITYLEFFARDDKKVCGFQDFTQAARHLPNGVAMSRLLAKDKEINQESCRLSMGGARAYGMEALRLTVHSYAAKPTVVPDASALFRKGDIEVKHPKMLAFRSFSVGLPAGRPEEVIWESSVSPSSLMRSIHVYYDSTKVYGIATVDVDAGMQLFGSNGEDRADGSEKIQVGSLELDSSMGESPIGMLIWTDDDKPIEGVQFITSRGASTERFGKTDYSPYRADVPRGFILAGLSGTVGNGIQSLRLIIRT